MLSSLWQDFLSLVTDEVGSRVVETWLKAVILQKWDAEKQVLHIEAPNQFVKEWIASKYLLLFKKHFKRLLHVSDVSFNFFIAFDSGNYSAIVQQNVVVKNDVLGVQINKDQSHSIIPIPIKNNIVTRDLQSNNCRFNPLYQFDNYITGVHNSLAYAAAQAICDKPGELYNPLFIYGGSGLGKTHLLHAIGNCVLKKNPKAVILYQTTDRFINEFINAIRFNKVHIFQQKYRFVDFLLIDDIQFLSNKEQTQEAFFHIFNALHELRKQVVFSSDLFPREIGGLAERLRSRFEWGLVADIHAPSLETKIAILKQKMLTHNEHISQDILEYIATSSSYTNVRELEGALVRVCAFSSLTGQEISLDLVRKVLGQTSNVNVAEFVNFDRIVQLVCRHYSYTLSDLRSNNRSKELTFVRHIAMYLMKKMTDKSLREISLYLCRKDHSTVIHAYDKVSKAIKIDPNLSSVVVLLEQRIIQS